MREFIKRAAEMLTFGVEVGIIYLLLRLSRPDTEAAVLTVWLTVCCLIVVIFFVEGGAER